MDSRIFTIGHSTHSIETFIDMLSRHGITAIGDVRSSPYSRYNPQYNKEALHRSLAEQGIKYVFLGQELGARSDDLSCYVNGRVQYEALAKTDSFQHGIERICKGVGKGFTMALMCAEKDPLDCHRTILVARVLVRKGFNVLHILEDGKIEAQAQAEDRLLKQFNLNNDDLFLSSKELLEKAFFLQEKKIAFTYDVENYGNSATAKQ